MIWCNSTWVPILISCKDFHSLDFCLCYAMSLLVCRAQWCSSSFWRSNDFRHFHSCIQVRTTTKFDSWIYFPVWSDFNLTIHLFNVSSYLITTYSSEFKYFDSFHCIFWIRTSYPTSTFKYAFVSSKASSMSSKSFECYWFMSSYSASSQISCQFFPSMISIFSIPDNFKSSWCYLSHSLWLTDSNFSIKFLCFQK